MIEQITKGIKISVGTSFEGKRYQNLRMYYAFSYSITIENQSSDTVQLISRHWNIFDSLSDLETVDGEGVVGEKPIIAAKQSYTYNSHCLLSSGIGAMNGHYNMVNFSSSKQFKVLIPTFHLTIPSNLN